MHPGSTKFCKFKIFFLNIQKTKKNKINLWIPSKNNKLQHLLYGILAPFEGERLPGQYFYLLPETFSIYRTKMHWIQFDSNWKLTQTKPTNTEHNLEEKKIPSGCSPSFVRSVGWSMRWNEWIHLFHKFSLIYLFLFSKISQNIIRFIGFGAACSL